MKKTLAFLLSVLCLLSALSAVALAGPFDEVSSMFAEDSKACLITYQNQTSGDISMMYKPNPSISVTGPGYLTVTRDTPLAVDHVFVCWKDDNGNYYYEGDKIYVDGPVTLYAVWEEKTDNDPRVLRVLKTAFQTLERMVLKFLGVFKDIQDFDSSYYESLSATTTTTAAEVG